MVQNVPPVSLLENIQKVPLVVYIYLLSRNKLLVCCLYYPSFAFLHFCQNSTSLKQSLLAMNNLYDSRQNIWRSRACFYTVHYLAAY